MRALYTAERYVRPGARPPKPGEEPASITGLWRRVVRVDEPAKGLLELPPVLREVEPVPVPGVLFGDHRIPGVAQAPFRPPLAAVIDGLHEVPDHEGVRIVLPRLAGIGRGGEVQEIRVLEADPQQVEIDAVQLGVVAVPQCRPEAPDRIEQGEDDAEARPGVGDYLDFRPHCHHFGSVGKRCHAGRSSQPHSSRTGSDTSCNIWTIRGSSNEQRYTSR